MTYVCPACGKSLSFADEPPRFCAYCGERLKQSTQEAHAPLEQTAAYIAPPIEPSDATPGVVGGYRLLRLLGTGGMGRVFEAEPLAGGPHVAVKLLSNRLQSHATSVERFRQEGRLAAQIVHPNCVFVIAADADQGQPYIAMELMTGATLKDLVEQRGPLPADEAIRLIIDAIDGLIEAHRLGVIHRDVKPTNCFLLENGQVKIGDFGLSKAIGSTNDLTQSGAFLGTVLYASPEQIRGQPVDFATDVYSISATLYYLLTGQPPFFHENVTAALAKIISEDPVSIRSLRPELSSELARVVHKGLEREKSRRYATLSELRADLVMLIPETLSFGSMGIRIAAYAIDEFLVRVTVAILLAVLLGFFPMLEDTPPVAIFLLPLYFCLMEGWWGRSFGKWLLGLRVCRQGTTEVPGLKRVALRNLVFFLLVILTFSQLQFFLDKVEDGRLLSGLFLNILPFGIGLVALIAPMRRRNDFRGLHEILSGTCVMRRPQFARPLRLVSRRGDRLEELPARTADFPASIGNYTILRVRPVGSGWIALGNDPLLNRRVLFSVEPDDAPRKESASSRPTRLWSLGTGTVVVRNQTCRWSAFVAPAGAPLADVVEGSEPIRWLEARAILRELFRELQISQAEGSLPSKLSLDQIWMQPDGKFQVVEWSLGLSPPLSEPDWMRQVTRTLLEGEDSARTGPIAAPMPVHATRWCQQLWNAQDRTQLAACQKSLEEQWHRPARVTSVQRFFQMLLHTLFMLPGLFFLYFCLIFVGSVEIMINPQMKRMIELRKGEQLLREIEENPSYLRNSNIKAYLTVADDPTFVPRLQKALEREQGRLRPQLPRLHLFDRLFLRGFTSIATVEDAEQFVVDFAQRGELDPLPPMQRNMPPILIELFWIPVAWSVLAFLFRGSLTYWLTGMALVSIHGGPARRWRCLLRSLLAWIPITLLLGLSAYLQLQHPYARLAIYALWVAALSLPFVYLLTLFWNPERGPHDRLLGTWLVPR